MHELALCGAIADIAARQAGEHRVAVVHVQVGQLRQVVPDTLAFCWSVVVDGTSLDGTVLDVDRVDARLHCRACAEDSGIGSPPAFVCSTCGSFEVTVTAGEEFAVTAVDLTV